VTRVKNLVIVDRSSFPNDEHDRKQDSLQGKRGIPLFLHIQHTRALSALCSRTSAERVDNPDRGGCISYSLLRLRADVLGQDKITVRYARRLV
jgi:hypothetical protein